MDLTQLLAHKNLWPHQKECLDHCVHYLSKYNSKDPKSTLNRLPTGSGKSGIITVLTRAIPKYSHVLVLTPSSALRDQLTQDIGSVFFESVLKIDNSNFPKKCYAFFPKTINDLLDKNDHTDSIWVGTIQALYEIYNENKKAYDRLGKIINLVVFDEGHREPAPEWASAVRALEKPTVLFTATPYRNDRKKFTVDPSYIYGFKHEDALKGNFIRNIEFIEIEKGNTVTSFIKQVITFYEEKLKKNCPKGVEIPRVIIRAKDHNEIISITQELENAGYSTLAIHDQFKDKLLKELKEGKKGKFLERVPNLKKEKEGLKNNPDGLKKYMAELPIFWVHQYKLLEGIDEQSFCAVANYAPMTNARMLVQQAGRIIRNSQRIPNETAFFLYQKGSPDFQFWKGYLKYEGRYEDASYMDIYYYQEIFDSVSAVLPDYHYVSRDYKKKFEWNEIQGDDGEFRPDKDYLFHQHTNFRLSTYVYKHDGSVDLKEVAKEVRIEYIKNEIDIRHTDAEFLGADGFFLPYFKVSDTPALSDTYFFNFHYGYVVCFITDKYLFFQDSLGTQSSYIRENFDPLHPNELKKLFRNNNSSLQHITLRSTELNNYTIRRADYSARSLGQTAGDMVDYLQFFSVAKGRTNIFETLHNAQSSVGFTKSRITELTEKLYNVSEYKAWIIKVSELLKKRHATNIIFDRYASFVDPPSDPSPVNILIDFDEIRGKFYHAETDDELTIDDKCIDIEKGVFDLAISYGSLTKDYEVKIIYDTQRRKYSLECPMLKTDFRYYDEFGTYKQHEHLCRYLNREQCFRVIPTSNNIIYAHNHFYQPRLAIYDPKKKDKIELLNIFEPISELNKIGSEKGTVIAADKFEKNSLFDFIDNLGFATAANGFLKDLDVILCDDAGDTEVADFIGLQFNPKRIVLIHAKAFDNKKVRSATAFQEVCSQAVKNLAYLLITTDRKPPNFNLWDNPYKAAHITGSLKRIRKAPKKNYNGANFWADYLSLVRNPSIQREVYIFMGQGFDLKAFKKNVDSKKPDPANLQIMYQLQSTWSNVMKIASDFKIFCS